MLSLETRSGLTLSGLPTSQDSMTAPTIMISRDTTRITSQPRDFPVDPERDIDRNDQRLVGERVEIGAEHGGHVEALGEKAVDGVADAGGEEQHEGRPMAPDAIAQTTIGTSRMRPSVMRFGMLKVPRLAGAPRLLPATRQSQRRSITARGPLRDLRFRRTSEP